MENFCLKYCLKWNNFETNIRDSFRKLREDQILFDVTLATEYGEYIKAHKMVLAAVSNFFNDIMLICPFFRGST